jgi:hypothetical protein
MLGLAVIGLLGFPNESHGQYTLEQKSNPAGLIPNTNNTFTAGSNVQVSTPPLHTNGYSFTHWTFNGVRHENARGQAIHERTFPLQEATTAVAHYLPENLDSDGDGLPDWQEMRAIGSLDQNDSADPDGDGFSLADEHRLELPSQIKNEIAEGGISLRRSVPVFLNLSGAKKLTIRSNPDGLISSTENYRDFNTSFTSENLSGISGSHAFSHWEINGVRIADGQGVGLNQVSGKMSEDIVLEAKFFPVNQDTDGDGMADWYEWKQFGNLNQVGGDDPDLDGYSLAEEGKFGLSPTVKDEFHEGGVSIRRSGITFLNLSGAKKLIISSNPPGLITGSESYRELNSTYTSQNLTGITNGYVFSHWEINGVRMASPQGLGLNQVSGKVTQNTVVEAKFYAQNEDTDGDGIADWFEWRQFGNLGQVGENDADGDGFSLADEGRFGLSPSIPNEIHEGGLSMRRSSRISYSVSSAEEDSSLDSDGDGITNAEEIALGIDPHRSDTDGDGYPDGLEVAWGSDANDPNSLANYSPTDFSLSNNTLHENQPVGTEIGEFNATDQDANSSHSYKLVDGERSGDNSFFSLDTNGTLSSAVVFDYENNESNYSIRVRVSDEHNTSLEKTFTINLIDQNEPPVITHIEDREINGELIQNITVNENTGLNIEINATDPDDDILSYFKTAGGDRNLFNLNASSGLFSYSFPKFDYENPQDENADNIYIVWVRVLDEKGGFDEKRLRIIVSNVIEDNDGDGIEDFYDPDDDNDGFSDVEEIAKGTDPFDVHSVPNAPPSSLTLHNLRLFENLPAGSIIGELNATDPDANSSLTITLFDENGSNDNHLFIIDENDSLCTTRTFDYETDDWNYSIRVAVTDEHNLSIERTFIIPLLNIVEDLDSDGIEDFYDRDDDNDGFPDTYEVGYGSNPRDANSTANIIPDLLDLNGSVVEWNATAGAVVGQFAVNDPDENASLSLQFVDTNYTDHDLFMIDENYSLITTQAIPYGRVLPALLIHVRLTDEWNASIEKTFEIVVTAKPKIQDSNQTFDSKETIIDGNQSEIVDGNFSAWWGNERPDLNGWVIDSAMGTFRPHENGWFYHLHLGWLYASPAVDDSLWVWSSEHRWLWTRKDVFPFVYRWEDANWLYFFLRSDGAFHIFNYASDSYE